jgi:hypothetical protein
MILLRPQPPRKAVKNFHSVRPSNAVSRMNDAALSHGSPSTQREEPRYDIPEYYYSQGGREGDTVLRPLKMRDTRRQGYCLPHISIQKVPR